MSDDLVKRLRKGGSYEVDVVVMEEAACCIEELEQLFDLRWAADMRAIKAWQIAHPDQPKTWPDHADLGTWCLSRIEKLEAALHEWDALIHHQYTGSREAMSDMQYAAQITAALLHGEAPWPETRIEKLEAALDEAAFSQTLFDAVVGQRNKATDRIEKLETALREIAEANSVQAGPDKDMYRRWRRVATNAIDIARKALEDKQ